MESKVRIYKRKQTQGSSLQFQVSQYFWHSREVLGSQRKLAQNQKQVQLIHKQEEERAMYRHSENPELLQGVTKCIKQIPSNMFLLSQN